MLRWPRSPWKGAATSGDETKGLFDGGEEDCLSLVVHAPVVEPGSDGGKWPVVVVSAFARMRATLLVKLIALSRVSGSSAVDSR